MIAGGNRKSMKKKRQIRGPGKEEMRKFHEIKIII
jgi:hypothetical protein